MTAWTDFVSKIHKEGQTKNPNYSFKQAMQDASKRKGEMNGSSSSSSKKSTRTKTSKKSKKGGKKGKSGTRRKRRSVKKH